MIYNLYITKSYWKDSEKYLHVILIQSLFHLNEQEL